MVRPIHDSAATHLELTEGWELALTTAGAWSFPEQTVIPWLRAIVPGTAAQSLAALGLWSLDRPEPLHDRDIWYRLALPGSGPGRLRFDGLATIAEIWLDGERLLDSDSMFVVQEIAIERTEASVLHIAFRSLDAALAERTGKRARWRSTMIEDARLRLVRTTLLGHMPGWCPPVDTVGPFRPVTLIESAALPIDNVDLRSNLIGSNGQIDIAFKFDGTAEKGYLLVDGHKAPVKRQGDHWAAQITLESVALWWPQGYGEPNLYPVELHLPDRELFLGSVGFRSIELDLGEDEREFRLVVNDVPVFCRGAVWTPADLVSLPGTRAAYEPLLRLAQEAGINMLRVGGTMVYETSAFHTLCDELGILVWQDFMFANFDCPGDKPFLASVRSEAEQWLRCMQASPSLAILCGGSETFQQAAMMGLPANAWSSPLNHVLSEAAEDLRPDVPYVPSSPFGGDLPFSADAGCTHYYGVGAYRRPLEDARRANVRFASECLAFANVPDDAILREALPVPAVHHPRWKQAVPRDLGAAWDFEDVREHYTALLYGVDVTRLRTEDPQRYLDLARATTADVAEATIGEWRRPGSTAAGALVWFWRDLIPGAGWGIVDALGRPKSIWHGLKRAFRPLTLVISDEGVNGLHVHAINDGPKPVAAKLSFACLRDGRLPVASGARDVVIAPGGSVTMTATELLGAFFDTNYCYRFGPAAHDVSLARLTSPDGTVLVETTHWLAGRRAERHDLGLAAKLAQDESGWFLTLSTDRMAAHLHIDDDHFRGKDDGFDLAPGTERIVRLIALHSDDAATPEGEVRAINGAGIAQY